MPEGHTIHRLARDIERDLLGQTLGVSSPQEEGARFERVGELDGATLRATEAVGKHLFLHFDRATVHIHLGLFGRFRRSKNPAPDPRGALRLRLVGDEVTWDLRGPTRCEILDDEGQATLRARLGADPLAETSDPEPAWQKIRKTKRPLGAVLLDQTIFSGLGNVYRAELLFLLRLHPEMPANALTRRQFLRLWKLARELLARGVKEKRIVTRKAPKGVRLKKRDALHVYARRECLACGSGIRRWTVGTRHVYACETCQPPPPPPPPG